MTNERVAADQPQIQEAVSELRRLIAQRYPTAEFSVFEGEDPQGTYLRAMVDTDDLDQVVDVFIDQLLEFQVERHLPVYVLPLPLKNQVSTLRPPSTRFEREPVADPPLLSR